MKVVWPLMKTFLQGAGGESGGAIWGERVIRGTSPDSFQATYPTPFVVGSHGGTLIKVLSCAQRRVTVTVLVTAYANLQDQDWSLTGSADGAEGLDFIQWALDTELQNETFSGGVEYVTATEHREAEDVPSWNADGALEGVWVRSTTVVEVRHLISIVS